MSNWRDQLYVVLRNAVGDSVSLTGPIYLTEIDGIGLVKPNRYVRSGPQQHGQTLGQALMMPRVVTLGLLYKHDLDGELEADRETLQRMLNDLNHAIWLDVIYPSGISKRLDVYYYDGLTGPRSGNDLYGEAKDAIQLVADTPIFYGPSPEIDAWPLGGGDYYYTSAEGLFIPWLVPFGISASTILANSIIRYDGTWEEYPIWNIYGPASKVRLENVSTGEILQFTDDGFVEPNDVWTIDLRYGHKDVVNLAGLNKAEFLTTDSDIATWHLAPHAEVTQGRNALRLIASDCDENSKLEMTWYRRYNGA